VQHSFGWRAVNFGVIPFILIMLVAVSSLLWSRRRLANAVT